VVRTFRGCQRAPVHLENRASAPTSLTRISFVMGLTVGFPFGGWSKANATTAPRGSLPWRLPGWTPAPPMDGMGECEGTGLEGPSISHDTRACGIARPAYPAPQ
jgi:hypothetical protein